MRITMQKFGSKKVFKEKQEQWRENGEPLNEN